MSSTIKQNPLNYALVSNVRELLETMVDITFWICYGLSHPMLISLNVCRLKLLLFSIIHLLFSIVEEELSKETKLLGFPIEHKHKLCCLRQELIDSFVDARYMMFIKYAAYHLQQINLKSEEIISTAGKLKDKKDEEEKKDFETEEAKKIVESVTEGNKLESNLIYYECIIRN